MHSVCLFAHLPLEFKHTAREGWCLACTLPSLHTPLLCEYPTKERTKGFCL